MIFKLLKSKPIFSVAQRIAPSHVDWCGESPFLNEFVRLYGADLPKRERNQLQAGPCIFPDEAREVYAALVAQNIDGLAFGFVEARISEERFRLVSREEMTPERRTIFRILRDFCAEGLDLQPGVGAQKPTRKWLAYADSWLTEERLALLLAQLQGYELPGPEVHGYHFDYEMKTYRDLEQSVLRYWVWVLSLRPLEQVGTVLEQLIVRGSEKIPGIGPRSKRLAFAAIWALENHGDSKGRAHLHAARKHVTYKSIASKLDRAMTDS